MIKALVLIDVQKGMFSDPSNAPHDGEAVVDRIAALIAKARTAKTPVFFVQHDGGPEHPFFPGKPGFSFHEKLAPRPGDDVTVKHRSSAFHETDFDAKLKAADVDHLVITGMQSEYCVDSAIRGAYERGYKITLVSDAHSTAKRPRAKTSSLSRTTQWTAVLRLLCPHPTSPLPIEPPARSVALELDAA